MTRKKAELPPAERVERSREVERKLRAAAEVEGDHVPGVDWWPRSSDLEDLFMVSRSMVHRWLAEGVEIAGQRMLIWYTTEPGNIREARPSDVLAVLEARRKLRSADHPDGGVEGVDTPGT